MALRDEFIAALRLVADAVEEVASQGLSRPVLVGGAAVEFYSGGAFVSGDLDFVTEWQPEFEAALMKRGFVKDSRPGALTRGVIHPNLDVGVEVVGSSLLDGAADEARILLVHLGAADLPVIAVEDIIADRLGQYDSGSGGHAEMLAQAIWVFRMAQQLDATYLDRRIREETGGSLTLDFLKRAADEANQS
jgi:hypothetical protein